MSLPNDVSYEELVEAMKKTIEDARLDQSQLHSKFQPIYMGEESSDDILLMQMSPELLLQINQEKGATIRGESDELAVLCTKSKTYELKETETSNSLLLVSKLSIDDDLKAEMVNEAVQPRQALGIFNSYMEIKPCVPRLKKLRELLEKNPYDGEKYEETDKEKYSFDDLLSLVQASEEQINEELERIHACEIKGYIRILSLIYKFHAFSHIRETVEAESIEMNCIPKDYIITLLSDLYPKFILDKIFEWYTIKTDKEDENGNALYSLKEDEVCKLYAEVLIKPSHSVNREDFLKSWQISVPEGLVTKLDHLKGWTLSLLDRKPQSIFYFAPEMLPEEIPERFKALFEAKPKWTYEEIEPYLKEYEAANLNIKSLLSKFARASHKDGELTYVSKW